jgi:hypothetical protein
MKMSAWKTFLVSVRVVFGTKAMLGIMLPFLLFSLVILLVPLVYTPSYTISEIWDYFYDVVEAFAIYLGLLLLLALYKIFVSGAIAGMVKHGAETGKASLGAGFGMGARKFLFILLASIPFALMVMIGIALLVIPGLLLLVLFIYFIPAIVIDNCGPLSSLRKSYRVSRRNMGYSIALLIIFLLTFIVPGIVIYFTRMLPEVISLWVSAILATLFYMLLYPLIITTITIGYLNLK